MDRSSWMYESRRNTAEYLIGVEEFIRCAETDMTKRGDRAILCPCRDCQNLKRFKNTEDVRDHLIRRGFKDRYIRWWLHGEEKMSENAGTSQTTVESEGNFNQQNELSDSEFPENVESEQFVVNNELEEMMVDVEADFVDIPDIFENFCNDSKIPLFPGCTKFTKLSAVFKLYNLKAKNSWSDQSFTDLLELLRDMLPENNVLPDSTYRAKKLLCPLSMEVERIHACPNDCILYRGEYSELDICPKCGASRYKTKHVQFKDRKPPAAKVLFYLPVIPRFRRLFANPRDAKLLRWHADCRKIDGQLRHPADSPEWRNIDRAFPDFGKEARNLRLGLCTDGMNPYGAFSSRKTTWPVLLCIYNLPPWMCMKRKYIMLSLLISGPKQPGNDIDVFLSPLIEDMENLWKNGVQIFDANTKETFTLRAMIFCTINDFPAYGNLSGYKIKGAKACPICGNNTCSLWLRKCKKTVFMGHRKHLRINHPYRRKKKAFDGNIELERAPKPANGREVHCAVKDLNVQFGKGGKEGKTGIWKKRSIFWNLPYWPHLEVRHCLDVMHIVKNIAENICGLLNIYGKAKDSSKVRDDLVEMGIRPELAAQKDGNRTYLPPACYTLSKRERISLLECLKSIKVPSGYSSNISQKVSMKDLKLIGMKSHDFHVLLTQLLPIAIRGILPQPVRHTITKLCYFYNSICSKVIDPETLDELQADVVLTLCELEMYFPPSFFDIMVHLTVHLVREIKLCGPVFLRYMYPFERAMGQLKRLARSRSRPEGSIVEGYIAEEVIEFYSDYLDGVESVGLPKSRHEGRLQGAGLIGYKLKKTTYEERQKAHLKVLQHLTDVAPYVTEHMSELRQLNPSKPDGWIDNEHSLTFAKWFRKRVKSQASVTVSETVKLLASGPVATVHTYQGYDMNGYTWYTKQQDGKSTNQNSSVTLVAFSGIGNNSAAMSYYGWIEEIWELDYVKFRIPLFVCKWMENRRGVRTDKDGFVSVDLSRLGYQEDPFILAKQAKQVFYVADPADKKWHVVLQGKRRIVGIGDIVDEEEYDQFDEIPPFSSGVESIHIDDNQETTLYMREDHQEGTWVNKIIRNSL